VTKLKLVTPGMGTMELTKEDGELFELAKVGLGCLGVVVEVTMECIPAHRLVEHTFVLTRNEAKEQLDTLLKLHKHMRYMWVPYTDVVVVVTNDPEDQVPKSTPRKASSASSPEEKSRPLTDFLAKISKNSSKPYTEENMKGMAFGELRGTFTR
jgi:L-galactono-1,4-lactone dehydrogenase